MRANSKPRLFLDTSVLISLALSTREHPPGRYFFEMAIHGLVDIVVSRNVTNELEGVLRDRVPDRAPTLIAYIAESLVLAHAMHASEPNEENVRECLQLVSYKPDAKIVASAIETACEVMVTLDTEHLLNNPKIGPPNTELVVMGMSEALRWCQDQVSVRSRYRP